MAHFGHFVLTLCIVSRTCQLVGVEPGGSLRICHTRISILPLYFHNSSTLLHNPDVFEPTPAWFEKVVRIRKQMFPNTYDCAIELVVAEVALHAGLLRILLQNSHGAPLEATPPTFPLAAHSGHGSQILCCPSGRLKKLLPSWEA